MEVVAEVMPLKPIVTRKQRPTVLAAAEVSSIAM